MADPNLQIKEGPSHPDPEISGGPVSTKFFAALRATVWSDNKGGGAGPPGPSLDPPLYMLLVGLI